MKLAVYVPVEGTAAMADVPRGGAIVGDPASVRNGRMLATVDGGPSGVLGLRGFSDRVRTAAALNLNRDAKGMGLFDVGHMVQVASYDTERGILTDIVAGTSLSHWSGESLPSLSAGRLPVGVPGYEEVADSIRQGRRIGPVDDGMAYMTASGQVILLGQAGKGYEVLSEDDPRLPSVLEADGGISSPRP